MSMEWKDPLWYFFIAGGIGDMTACCFSHPIDTLKVRMQLRGELSRTLKRISTVRQIDQIETLRRGVVVAELPWVERLASAIVPRSPSLT